MKKIFTFAVCALVAFAGVLGVGGNVRVRVSADAVPIPTDLKVYYYDSLNSSPRGVSQDGSLAVTYGTIGCLYIVNGAEETIFDEKLTVTLGGDVVCDECDYNSETGRLEYFWNCDTIGVYHVKVEALVVVHEHNEMCDIKCEEPGTGNGEFSFDLICNSRTQANLQVIYTAGRDVNDGSSQFYSDVKEGFGVTVAPGEPYFFWNESSVKYETKDEKLSVGGDGKTLLLHAQSKGTYTVEFTVTYDYVTVKLVEGDWVVSAESQSVDFIKEITFNDRPKPASFWDVLLGVAILGALGAAVYFVSKLSKSVENK
jgi:hypothetical protein